MDAVPFHNQNVEEIIRQNFEDNFERLRLESGHSLSPAVKEIALQQVLLYWRRLHDLAKRITDTEVHLNLRGLKTKKDRKFCIEGVVDIIQEDNLVILYDLKTHDLDSIRGNISEYERQLNIYAHIWQILREKSLNQVAIISTAFPETIKTALTLADEIRLNELLNQWNPLVEIPINDEHINEVINDFGSVVDDIEDHKFIPPKAVKLKKQFIKKDTFASRICSNCDARFSCSSWCDININNSKKKRKKRNSK